MFAVCATTLLAIAVSAPPDGFRAIFDGSSLEGWEGNTSIWRVEDGMIVGEHKGRSNSEFLATKRSYRDFFLTAKFRLVDGRGGGGIQFRGRLDPEQHEMIGYHAGIGGTHWGFLFGESRRRTMIAEPPKDSLAALKSDYWHDYAIRCMSNRVELYLDGVRTVRQLDKRTDAPRAGVIALQVQGDAMPARVEFKDIFIQDLPFAKPVAKGATGFLLKSAADEAGKPFKYTVYIPPEYHKRSNTKWPMIVFLHGGGEKGDDGELPIKVGIGPAVLKRPAKFPFVILFPQAQTSWLADSDDAKRMLGLVAQIKEALRIDPDRVHLTGLSMGGVGGWTIVAQDPILWATFSMLGGGKGDKALVDKIKSVPYWSFCGDKESPATVDWMRERAKELASAGGEAKYTEYPGIGSICWDKAYNEEPFQTWLRSTKRTKQ